MAFTQITVTGTYLDASGAPLSGSVTFRLSTSMHDAAGGVVRAAEPVVATLDASGRLSVSLAANDDPTTSPTGVTYAVEERLTGADGTVTADYSVVVPHNAVGGTVLITALAPVTNQSVSYGVLSVDGQTGAVTTDPDLLTIAALDSTVAGALATDGAGWVRKTYAAVKTALALVKADVGLGNVDNTSDVNKPVSTAQAAADALKVAKAGDTMSGDLAMGTNRVTGLADPALAQDAATRAYVLAQIAALVNSAPAILDTLGEIATQLQSDESTATALATTVAGKLAKASNLSDLASAVTARTNLGLGSIATHPTSDFLTPAQGNGSYAPFSTARKVGPSAPNRLLPSGSRIKLANITTVKPAQWAAYAGQGPAYLWAEWDWAGWIKPQIDEAVLYGANTVRFIGCSVGGFVRNQLSLATYAAQWDQFIAYCASVGLWVYPAGHGLDDMGGLSQADAQTQIIAIINAIAPTFNKYPNVIAVDLANESLRSGSEISLTTPSQYPAFLTPIRNAWTAASTIPATFSHASAFGTTTNSFWGDTATRALMLALVDLWDYHCYYDAVPSDLNAFFTDTANLKPLLIGECGQTFAAGATARQSRYNALQAILERPDVLGGGIWALRKQDEDPSDDWALGWFPGDNLADKWEATFENNTVSGWGPDAPTRVSLAATTTPAIDGTYSMLVTSTVTNAGAGAYRFGMGSRSMLPGAVVTVTAKVQWVTGTPEAVTLRLKWQDAALAQLSTNDGAAVTPGTGAASTVTVTATAPAGAVNFNLLGVFGTSTTAIGDAFVIDDIVITVDRFVGREFASIFATMPAAARGRRIVLTGADATLNGGTGVYVNAPTGMSTTLAYGVGVRARITMVMDAQAVTVGDAITGRVLIDGVAIDASVAKFVGQTANSEGTVHQTWSTYLSPNVAHVIQAQYAVTGTGTTDKVIGANSKVLIELDAA